MDKPRQALTLSFGSITARLMVAGMIWCVLVVALGSMGLRLLYDRYQRETYYARMITNLQLLKDFHNNTPMEREEDAQEARSVISGYFENGRYDKPYSAWYWQIRGSNGMLVGSRSLFDCELVTNKIRCPGVPQGFTNKNYRGGELLGSGTVSPGFDYEIYTMRGPLNQRLRIIVSNFVPHHYLPDTFQYSIAGRYIGLEEVGYEFVVFLATAVLAFLVGTLLAVYFSARYGLQPLNKLRTSLADIRAGRTDRLVGDFPAEVEPLVKEFHEVIRDRNRKEVENLAHNLKTPLSVLINESAEGDSTLADVVRRQSDAIGRSVEHYLQRARRPMTKGILSPRINLLGVLQDVQNTMGRTAMAKGVDVELNCPADVSVQIDEQDLTEMIQELVDNATKWAQTKVVVAVVLHGENIVTNIEDDGPGVPSERRDEVVQRGVRLDKRVPGTGIGLANVRDIVMRAGGSVVLKSSRLGGLRVAITLPGRDR